ncbi:hypothetical protein AB0M43_07655 [Longispora sp. NPDC051575]|uniref:hypothetical protein n=1 Tax=Longispora sp. NPDC051575 TaxID=3154943 RepID=UPI00341B0046
MTVYFTVDGTRTFQVSVNGGPDVALTLTGSSWASPALATVTVTLNAGANTVNFRNDTAYAPGLDRVRV